MRAAHGLGLSLLVACSSAQRPEPALEVVRTPPSTAPLPPGRSAARPSAPAWLAEALAWPPVTGEPLRSAHFTGAPLAEIRTNPEARATYLALVTDSAFAEGTRFIETLRHVEGAPDGRILTLSRTASGWEFGLLDGQGAPLESGPPSACADCHSGAPAAPVFGLPRASKPRN